MLPRYQKQSRNATLNRIYLSIQKNFVPKFLEPQWNKTFLNAYIRTTLFILIFLFTNVLQCTVTHARPANQWADEDRAHLLLVPMGQDDAPAVELQMHTAELNLTSNSTARADAELLLTLEAVYRLKNVSDRDITQRLFLQPVGQPQNRTLAILPIDEISLAANGVPLSLQDLQSTESSNSQSVGYGTEIFIPTSKQVNLLLRYNMALSTQHLNGIYYDLSPLAAWPGSYSLRINMILNGLIDGDSWVKIGPDNWNFAPSEAGSQADIRWLYDLQLPPQPPQLQFIHPLYWRLLQEAEDAAQPNALPYDFSHLGQLYQELYQNALLGANSAISDRFYAQALAAYTAGIRATEQNSVPLSDVAQLHVGLANLYRTHTVADASGKTGIPDENQIYIKLMIAESAKATTALPKDDPNLATLYKWQYEGLKVLLDDVVQKEQWSQALAFLDELDKLPDIVVDHVELANQRRDFKLRQALQLLEAEKQNAAYVLAQTQLDSEGLLPPMANQSLFSRWQISVTVNPVETDIVMTTFPVPSRTDEAWSALQTVVEQWRELEQEEQNGYTFELYEVGSPELSASRISDVTWRLALSMAAPTTPISLTKTLPPEPDWALLHALLSQIGTRYEQRTERLWQQEILRQPMDLGFVAEQWDVMAQSLEEQAAQYAVAARQSTATAEEVLRSRIQATNYGEAAQVWRNLTQNSWAIVNLSLAEPDQESENVTTLGSAPPKERAWLVTPKDPLQVLEIENQHIGAGRLIGLLALLLFGLFLLATVLWWLL